MTALGGLFGSASILAWGDLAVRIGDSRSESAVTGRHLALAWLAGCIITSWLVFVTLWMGASLAPSVLATGAVGLAAWTAQAVSRRRPAGTGRLPRLRAQGGWWSVALSLVIVAVVAQVAFLALARPLVAWDAWVNWASKAHVLVVDQNLGPALHADPARMATNPGYPLMLPLVEAWMFTWTGDRSEASAGLLSLLFFVAMLGVFVGSVRSRLDVVPTLAITALLVTSPRLDLLAASGLADLPMATLVLAAFTAVLRPEDLGQDDQSPCGAAFVLPAILCAGLPWLKQEGWIWWVLAVTALVVRRRRGGIAVRSGVVALATIPPLLWQLFLLCRGTVSFAFLPITVANLVRGLDRVPAIAAEVATHLLAPSWNLLWPLVGLTLVVRGRRAMAGPEGKAILAVAVFILAVAGSYMLTRFEPFAELIANTIDRLLWQGAPLAWWWLATRFAGPGDPAVQLEEA